MLFPELKLYRFELDQVLFGQLLESEMLSVMNSEWSFLSFKNISLSSVKMLKIGSWLEVILQSCLIAKCQFPHLKNEHFNKRLPSVVVGALRVKHLWHWLLEWYLLLSSFFLRMVLSSRLSVSSSKHFSCLFSDSTECAEPILRDGQPVHTDVSGSITASTFQGDEGYNVQEQMMAKL